MLKQRKYVFGARFLVVLVYMVLADGLPAVASPAAERTPVPTHKRAPAVTSGVPTFADSAKDDDASNDDPVVRQAAVTALGHYNGSVVAIDPSSGRILSIVNQKLVFSTGYSRSGAARGPDYPRHADSGYAG